MTSLPDISIFAPHMLTAALLRDHGFVPVPTRADNPKALAYSDSGRRVYRQDHWKEGMGSAIRLGRRPDGHYLCRLDLDGHRSSQDPRAALATLWQSAPAAMAKSAIKTSTSGTGIDIIFLSPRPIPNNRPSFIDDKHVGEGFCDGGYCPLTGHWLSGHLFTLIKADEAELEPLFATVHFQCGTRNPLTWTACSREGLSLTRGHERVRVAHFIGAGGVPKTFQGTSPVHRIATKHWHTLPGAAPGERNQAYANVLQALMLLASPGYGTTVSEKCQTVAAIALQVCPEHGEPGYDAVKDTAAIIAKILHGDPYTTHPGRFLIPYWGLEYHPPIPRSPRAGRPPGSWMSRLAALRRLLLRHAEGARVEHLITRHGAVKLTVAALARQLRVSVSTARRDLAQLEAQREIIRDEASGRNGQLIVVLQPSFAHVADGDRPGHHQQMQSKSV